jgi:hypothetical protein
MSEQVNKASLLDAMRTGYTALENTLSPLDEAQMTTPGVNGTWSIKDNIAHIVTWQRILLDRLLAAARDETPTSYGSDSAGEDIDRLNEQFYQQNKSRQLAGVLADFRSIYAQIEEAVQSTSEEDLIDPQRFTWAKGIPLWRYVAGDTYEHYLEHITSIQGWLSRTGQR